MHLTYCLYTRKSTAIALKYILHITLIEHTKLQQSKNIYLEVFQPVNRVQKTHNIKLIFCLVVQPLKITNFLYKVLNRHYSHNLQKMYL